MAKSTKYIKCLNSSANVTSLNMKETFWFFLQKGELDDAMFMALVKNRPDFIELLLGNGLSLKDFLTIRNMLRLYNDVSGLFQIHLEQVLIFVFALIWIFLSHRLLALFQIPENSMLYSMLPQRRRDVSIPLLNHFQAHTSMQCT